MAKITITLVNGKLVRDGLENLRKAIPLVSRTRMREAVDKVIARMQRYPPKLPGQKYVRTFTLRRSWKFKSMPTGYAIMSDAVQKGRHYTKYVVGDGRGKQQAQIHAGRWPLFREVVDAVFSKLPKSIAQGLRGVTKGAKVK